MGRDFLPSVFLGGEGRERAVRQTAAEIREAHLLMLSKISLAERSTFVTRRCLELWVISDSVNHQEKNQAGQKNATKRVRNDHARAREPPEGERERETNRMGNRSRLCARYGQWQFFPCPPIFWLCDLFENTNQFKTCFNIIHM